MKEIGVDEPLKIEHRDDEGVSVGNNLAMRQRIEVSLKENGLLVYDSGVDIGEGEIVNGSMMTASGVRSNLLRRSRLLRSGTRLIV
jgi:hypothetical protein